MRSELERAIAESDEIAQVSRREAVAPQALGHGGALRGPIGPWRCRKPTQGLSPFVGQHLDRCRQVERAKLRVGRNTQAGVATVDVFVAHAKALGAKIICIDINDATLAKAKELGADYIINSKNEDPVKKILDLTTIGVDVAVDALGSEITSNHSVLSLKRRGKHIQLGLLLTPSGTTPMPMARAIAYELDLLGSHGMAAVDYPQMLKLISEGKLKPQALITKNVSLENGTELLKNLDKNPATGVVILNP